MYDDSCSKCGGELFLLGTLGRIKYLRCRDCNWNTPVFPLNRALEDECEGGQCNIAHAMRGNQA